MVQIPVVETCCCGVIDLKTAGRIFGGLGVAANIILILTGSSIIVHLIGLALSCAWLYGMETEKTNFMLPTIILEAIGVGLLALFAFFVLIFGQEKETIKLDDNGDIEETKTSPTRMAIAIIVVSLPFAYFLIVKYSLYRRIKDNQLNTLPVQHIPEKNEV